MPKNKDFQKNSTENGEKEKRNPVISAFYNSGRWRRLAAAFAAEKGYICQACRNRFVNPDYKPFYRQFHVHHKVELTPENVSDPMIALNRENLMLLCQHCHTQITFSRDVLAPGLAFDEKGQVIKIEQRAEGDPRRTERQGRV